MFNLVLWTYLRVWIYFVIGICKGSEFGNDTQGSEDAWVCSWIMHEYTLNMPETEPKIPCTS